MLRLFPPSLRDTSEMEAKLAVKCVGGLSKKLALSWFESWAWLDEDTPSGKGLLSLLRQEFDAPDESVFGACFEVQKDNEEAEEELLIQDDGHWYGKIDSSHSWSQVAYNALRFGKPVANKVRITTSGPYHWKQLASLAGETAGGPEKHGDEQGNNDNGRETGGGEGSMGKGGKTGAKEEEGMGTSEDRGTANASEVAGEREDGSVKGSAKKGKPRGRPPKGSK